MKVQNITDFKNFNPYIYILYHQSYLLHYLSPFPASYPYKMNRGNISAPPPPKKKKMNTKYISLSGVAAQDESIWNLPQKSKFSFYFILKGNTGSTT